VALVVLLRGVNVGGHRTFRPAALAKDLSRLGVVNIGAAGTFVVRQPVGRTQLRAEFARRLPFDTEIMICDGGDIVRVVSADHFAREPIGPGVVRFASVLSRRPRAMPPLPIDLPAGGDWLVRLVARDGGVVVGQYRRDMKAIGCLGTLDRVLGVPVTTRNWNTMMQIAKVLAR